MTRVYADIDRCRLPVARHPSPPPGRTMAGPSYGHGIAWPAPEDKASSTGLALPPRTKPARQGCCTTSPGPVWGPQVGSRKEKRWIRYGLEARIHSVLPFSSPTIWEHSLQCAMTDEDEGPLAFSINVRLQVSPGAIQPCLPPKVPSDPSPHSRKKTGSFDHLHVVAISVAAAAVAVVERAERGVPQGAPEIGA